MRAASPTTLAKLRARSALHRAQLAEAPLLDRWWGAALAEVDGQRPDAARVVFTKVAEVLEGVADRRRMR